MSLPAILALAGTCAASGMMAYLLWRSRGQWPAIPAWTWDNILKLVALAATVAGAAVITALLWWLLDGLLALLVRDVNSPVAVTLAEGLVWGLKMLSAGILLIILSLGLVIGPRVFRFRGPGNTEAQFGSGDAPAAAQTVADAAQQTADEIKETEQ